MDIGPSQQALANTGVAGSSINAEQLMVSLSAPEAVKEH
jgi:hypothetical protein